MNNTKDSGMKMKDLGLWVAVILVTIGTVVVSFYSGFSGPIQALFWILWLVIALGLGLMTSTGKEVFSFAKESKIELQKVVWPTRPETIQTTSIVMIMVAVTGIVLWAVDNMMMWAIGKITHLG